MEKIKIFTDSASDISFENEKNLDIEMINFNITMGDASYVSRVDFDNETFYKLMGEYDGIPLTSQATAYEFQELYKKYYDEGYTDLVGILINREDRRPMIILSWRTSCFWRSIRRRKAGFTCMPSTEEAIPELMGMRLSKRRRW